MDDPLKGLVEFIEALFKFETDYEIGSVFTREIFSRLNQETASILWQRYCLRKYEHTRNAIVDTYAAYTGKHHIEWARRANFASGPAIDAEWNLLDFAAGSSPRCYAAGTDDGLPSSPKSTNQLTDYQSQTQNHGSNRNDSVYRTHRHTGAHDYKGRSSDNSTKSELQQQHTAQPDTDTRTDPTATRVEENDKDVIISYLDNILTVCTHIHSRIERRERIYKGLYILATQIQFFMYLGVIIMVFVGMIGGTKSNVLVGVILLILWTLKYGVNFTRGRNEENITFDEIGENLKSIGTKAAKNTKVGSIVNAAPTAQQEYEAQKPKSD